ncbi:unnamed protein product, partial [Ectocarpus sp. 12 AP-2014]
PFLSAPAAPTPPCAASFSAPSTLGSTTPAPPPLRIRGPGRRRRRLPHRSRISRNPRRPPRSPHPECRSPHMWPRRRRKRPPVSVPATKPPLLRSQELLLLLSSWYTRRCRCLPRRHRRRRRRSREAETLPRRPVVNRRRRELGVATRAPARTVSPSSLPPRCKQRLSVCTYRSRRSSVR